MYGNEKRRAKERGQDTAMRQRYWGGRCACGSAGGSGIEEDHDDTKRDDSLHEAVPGNARVLAQDRRLFLSEREGRLVLHPV